MSENNYLTARLISLFAVLCFCFVSEILGQPLWTERRPADPGYYIGIGSADKTPGTSLHIELARDQALAQIASSISVSITTGTTHQILEQTGVYEEQFSAIVRSVAHANLEGYELVDTWEDEQTYWVYYRLSVSGYAERLEARKHSAAIRSNRLFDSGMRALNDGNISDALTNLLQAAYLIKDFRGLGLLFPNGKDGFLDLEIYLQIQSILSGMDIEIQPPLVKTMLFRNPLDIIEIIMIYQDPQQKKHFVSNMPLKVRPPQISGSRLYVDKTNNKGKSLLLLPALRFEQRIQLEVVPNLPVLAGISNEEVRALLAGIIVPVGKLLVFAESPRVYLETEEKNMDILADRAISDKNIRSCLTAAEWIITDDPDRADIVINIHATTRKGIERQGIHTAFASGHVAIYKTGSNDVVFSMQLQEVNGAGVSFENAGNQALERLSEQLLQVFERHFMSD